jgi:hypothetical protein
VPCLERGTGTQSSPLSLSTAVVSSLLPTHRRRPRWPTVGGRGVWMCTVVVVGLVGVMPFWSFSPEFAGGFWWSASSPLCWFPWWRLSGGGRSGWSSFNKLVFGPERVWIFLFLASSSCCHGGRGREVEERWISRLYLVDIQLFPFLLCELMRVSSLAPAGETDLTVGVNRGVAPADVLLASLKSRRLRRVEDAATSTRLSPLKICSGDPAAACWCLFSPSGETTASMQAVADLVVYRRSQGLSCCFTFYGVLSVIWGQLPRFWMVLVASCFLT